MNEITKMMENIRQQTDICHILIISNITFSPYFISLIKLQFAKLDFSIDIQIIQYQSYSDKTEIIKNSNLVVVLLNFECQYPNWYNEIFCGKITAKQLISHAVEECKNTYLKLREAASCPILWFGYENADFKRNTICGAMSNSTKIINIINADVCDLLTEDDQHLDTQHLLATIGIANAYDTKSKYRWNAPYSQQMLQMIADEIYKQYLIYKGITKKCLVLDCDGVLWGGVLSEDGVGQIQLGSEGLGRPYQDFQQFLLTIYYHGVILAICSKNDLPDVLMVFREHSGMILKEEHISCFQVNWSNKPDGIRKIADILRIGLDSMVFVDDSQFEIESVRTLLPDVVAIQYDRETIYKSLSCFNLKNRIDIGQIVKRNLTYQSNDKRVGLRLKAGDFESYLKALDIKVDIHRTLTSELARIAELTQRTNQCSNGTRYTVAELLSKMENSLYRLYSVSVSDKFSDLGLVGAVGIVGSTLDLFSLSCRALGRNVEDEMMKVVINEAITEYKFVSTGKNETLKNLFARMNKRI